MMVSIHQSANADLFGFFRLLSLRDVNTFLVRQHVEHAEVLTGGMIETENKYSVLSARDGQAKQVSTHLNRH